MEGRRHLLRFVTRLSECSTKVQMGECSTRGAQDTKKSQEERRGREGEEVIVGGE
jgi:hypothetical protein